MDEQRPLAAQRARFLKAANQQFGLASLFRKLHHCNHTQIDLVALSLVYNSPETLRAATRTRARLLTSGESSFNL